MRNGDEPVSKVAVQCNIWQTGGRMISPSMRDGARRVALGALFVALFVGAVLATADAGVSARGDASRAGDLRGAVR